MCAVMLTACDKGSEEPSYSSKIELNKSEVTFPKTGGEEVVTFLLQNGQGGKVTAETSAEWLTVRAEFNSEVIITAEANEGDAREAQVVVKYATAKDAIITVKQKAGNVDFDEEFAAKRFEGQYFGKSGSTYNYFIIISDKGYNAGAPKAGGTYYFFDIYSHTAGDEGYPMLPDGTYTYDTANTYANGTISEEGSWYQVVNAAGSGNEAVKSYKSAKVTVKDGIFEAEIEFNDGTVHHVVYEGDLTAVLDYTTLTEDTTINIEGAEIVATNYGDIYEVGMQNWYLEIKKDNNVVLLDVFSTSTTDPSGAYTELAGSDYANKFIPGIKDGSSLVGSWFGTVGANNTFKIVAPMVDGTVQIKVTGNTATINYATYDDGGNLIEGSIKGSYTVAQAEM